MASAAAGQITAIGVMPAALRAVISFEADILPNTLATANSLRVSIVTVGSVTVQPEDITVTVELLVQE